MINLSQGNNEMGHGLDLAQPSDRGPARSWHYRPTMPVSWGRLTGASATLSRGIRKELGSRNVREEVYCGGDTGHLCASGVPCWEGVRCVGSCWEGECYTGFEMTDPAVV